MLKCFYFAQIQKTKSISFTLWQIKTRHHYNQNIVASIYIFCFLLWLQAFNFSIMYFMVLSVQIWIVPYMCSVFVLWMLHGLYVYHYVFIFSDSWSFIPYIYICLPRSRIKSRHQRSFINAYGSGLTSSSSLYVQHNNLQRCLKTAMVSVVYNSMVTEWHWDSDILL